MANKQISCQSQMYVQCCCKFITQRRLLVLETDLGNTHDVRSVIKLISAIGITHASSYPKSHAAEHTQDTHPIPTVEDV